MNAPSISVPLTARRIVKCFGLDTLDIIENQIDRLSEVPGIAKKRIAMIQKTWAEQKSIKEVMIFLQGHGVSTTYAVKIYKQYGESSVATVKTNPYQLAIDIFGIGFLTADKIARNVGVSPRSKFRYKAGIIHVLDKASEDGHCYLPESQLIPVAQELLTVKSSALEREQNASKTSADLAENHYDHEADERALALILSEMVREEQLIRDKDEELLYYKPSFFYSEQHLVQRGRSSAPLKVDFMLSVPEEYYKSNDRV